VFGGFPAKGIIPEMKGDGEMRDEGEDKLRG